MFKWSAVLQISFWDYYLNYDQIPEMVPNLYNV